MTPLPCKFTPPSKSNWPQGPWLIEPDIVTSEHAGFPIAILRRGLGHLCGYVGVPLDHPVATGLIDKYDFSVHGGVTYAETNAGYFWLGFDCAHAGDLIPFLGRTADKTYRPLSYVLSECISLADQLSVPIPIPAPIIIHGEDTLRLRAAIKSTYSATLLEIFEEIVQKGSRPTFY